MYHVSLGPKPKTHGDDGEDDAMIIMMVMMMTVVMMMAMMRRGSKMDVNGNKHSNCDRTILHAIRSS